MLTAAITTPTPTLYRPSKRAGKRGLRFTPHIGQLRALDSPARFTFVIAGTQSGKTCWGPIWLWCETRRCGSGDYLAATATYDLFKLKMLPEMKRLFVNALGWQWQASDRVIVSPDREMRIILRSAEAEGGLESASAKAAWLDECGQDRFRLEAWEAVQRRLSLNQGRVLGTTTPYNLGWLKTEIYDRWRAGDSDYRVIQFKSLMNPAFPRAEYDRAKHTLAAWRFAMFYDGEFSRPAGLIYSDFEAEAQAVDDFPIPAEWPRTVGVDFGGVHTALVWLAYNPDRNVYYLYRESLSGDKTTAEHVAVALEQARAENVIRWVGGAPSEDQPRRDWAFAGVSVRPPPISDVEAGIDRVISLVKPRRLFVLRSCRGILDELGTYSRALNEAGQPTDKIKDKETFHRLDALRYAATAILDDDWLIS